MWKYFFVMLWLLLLLSTGVHIFSRGFLLSRMAMSNVNHCTRLHDCFDANDASCLSKSKADELLNNINDSVSYCLPKKSRIILLVIDALKYDFGVYNTNLNRSRLPYENRLPIINRLLLQEPNNTRLMRFLADPPTTTLQRLKGLTTGSLPTFIDVGANFATPEINEDNLIDQIVNSNMSVVFMGDSTWTELFPKRFKREYPLPSFNMYDLDTVDTEIMKVLPSELKRHDWDLLIGHFLGVDHCGHRYGPMHSEMSRKLTEMNEMISMVVQAIDDDTTLFVIGDHGMTATGDHGGDTVDETNALLFAYTKRSFHKDDELTGRETRQIDLVPTIASVLGIAIPFSNLGTINYNLLPNIPNAYLNFRQQFLLHSWQNVLQLRHYFTNYTTAANDGVATTFANDVLDDQFMKFLVLSHRATTLYTDAARENFHRDHKQFLRRVLDLCRGVWVNFDAAQMSHGLIIVAIVTIQLYLLIGCMRIVYFDRIFTRTRILLIYLGNIVTAIVATFFYSDLGFVTLEHGMVVMIAIYNIGYMAMLCIGYWYAIAECLNRMESLANVLPRIVLIAAVSVFYSNSFIIEEQKILCYMVMGMILLLLHGIQRVNNVSDRARFKFSTIIRSNWMKMAAITVFALVSLRWSYKSFRCREEQSNCTDFRAWMGNSFDHKDLGLANRTERQEKADIVPVIVLAIFVTFARMFLRFCGSQVGFRPSVVMAKYGPIVAAFCIGGHFILSRAQMPGVKAINVDALAWCTYTIFALHLIVIIVCPLMVYVQRDPVADGESTYAKSIPSVFQMLKRKLGGHNGGNGDEEKAYVIGISTVYSSVIIAFAVTLTMLLANLLGPNASNGLFICLIAAGIILGLGAILRYQTARMLDICLQPHFVTLVAWTLLAQFSFYATSHQPTLSQIEWHAAFVGRSSTYDNSNFLSAILVLLNTFSGPILIHFMYPLLILAGPNLHSKLPSLVLRSAVSQDAPCDQDPIVDQQVPIAKQSYNFSVVRGELVLYENDEVFIGTMFKVGCQLVIFQSMRIFSSMLACTILSRHLMVWKIFAPRFMYEGLSTYVCFAAILFGFGIVLRTHTVLTQLVIKLTKTKKQ